MVATSMLLGFKAYQAKVGPNYLLHRLGRWDLFAKAMTTPAWQKLGPAYRKKWNQSMDIMKLPRCPFRARADFISKYSAELANRTVKYIQENYRNADLLSDCLTFMELDMLDCMRSDYDSLTRMWNFPVREAAGELGESINRMIQCAYKSVRDNLRRALELAVLLAYFGSSNISEADAKNWISSEEQTPFISQLLKQLCASGTFRILVEEHNWKEKIQSFYWSLCDTIHTRGREHSLRVVQPAHAIVNGIGLPEFNEEALVSCLDLFVMTIRNISVVFAAYNPVLLVGLPLIQKFGPDGPFSGFFECYQSDRLWRIIPKEFHPAFIKIAETDMDVMSARNWVENLPDWNGIA